MTGTDVTAPLPRYSPTLALGAGVGLVTLLAYCFFNALSRVHGDTGDFPAFYNAACAMLDGSNIYQTGFPDYIYPPLLAFLYTPFGLLSPPAAATAMLLFLLLVFTTALWVGGRTLAERFDAPPGWSTLLPILCLALFLSEDKVRGEFQMWQTNSLLLLSFCLALDWLDRRPVWAGVALAFAFNIKYLPVIFLPYLLLRQRWTVAAAFVATIPVFALLPALLIGWDLNGDYLATAYRGLFRLVGLDLSTATQAACIEPDIRSIISLSVTSAIARYLGPDVPNRVAYAAALGVSLIAGGWTWWQYRRAAIPFFYRADNAMPGTSPLRRVVALEWAALLLVLLIFSPQSNSRHYSMLVLANGLAVVALRHPCGLTPRWPLLAGIATFFLGSVLPTGSITTSIPRQVWGEVGGISWCALLMLLALVWFVLEDLRGNRAAPVGRKSLPRSIAYPALISTLEPVA